MVLVRVRVNRTHPHLMGDVPHHGVLLTLKLPEAQVRVEVVAVPLKVVTVRLREITNSGLIVVVAVVLV